MAQKRTPTLDIKYLTGFFHSWINVSIIGVSLLACFAVLLYFTLLKPINVFPSGDEFSFNYYTDYANQGNSIINTFNISDNIIEVDYELRIGFIDPYIAISISPKKDSVINLTNYNRIVLELEGVNTENIGFDINTTFNTSKGIIKEMPITFYMNILELNSHRTQYILDLKKLKVPDYWYANNNISPGINIQPDFKYIRSFNIGTAYGTTFNVPRSLKIYSIRFERNNVQLMKWLSALFLFSVIFLFVIHIINAYRLKRKSHVSIAYKPIEIQTEKNEEKHHNCIEYINKRFNDSELSLEKTAEEIGVHKRLVSNIIQESFHCNFKTYINQLRIHEAKRLLKESDLNIGEIAFKVGFNTQSHFNRVFKSLEGLNPTDFKTTEN